MKTLFLFGAIALLLATVGCGDDNGNPKTRLVDLSYSTCKNNTSKSTEQEYVDYKSTPDKYLDIKHVNVMFNCCPGKLTVNTVVNNDTIKILEKETEHDCDCICNYDLSYKIGPLEYKKYHVILTKGGLEKIKITINFNKTTKSKFNINH